MYSTVSVQRTKVRIDRQLCSDKGISVNVQSYRSNSSRERAIGLVLHRRNSMSRVRPYRYRYCAPRHVARHLLCTLLTNKLYVPFFTSNSKSLTINARKYITILNREISRLSWRWKCVSTVTREYIFHLRLFIKSEICGAWKINLINSLIP